AGGIQTPFGGEYLASPLVSGRPGQPQIASSVPQTILDSYSPYWNVVDRIWGERLINEPTFTEIQQLVSEHQLRAAARNRSNSVVAVAPLQPWSQRSGACIATPNTTGSSTPPTTQPPK
ncbi:hypothetical protein, partial [Nocardia gipuzkoensis]